MKKLVRNTSSPEARAFWDSVKQSADGARLTPTWAKAGIDLNEQNYQSENVSAPAEITNKIIHGDSLNVLKELPDKFVRMIYIDPPFNTGKIQKRNRIKVTRSSDEKSDRIGFGGVSYTSKVIDSPTYEDSYDDFESFLMERIKASLHTLTDDGSIFIHLDQREVHYIKVAMDKLIGRDKFAGELIWSYDFGARSKTKWSNKHDTILWYTMNPKKYVFHYDQLTRVPYMAPDLVGPEKAALGKTETDVIWNTIVPTNSKEKTGYPTQKPIALINRFVKIHTDPGDVVMDFFAGSGTVGESAALHNRKFVLVDQSLFSIQTMMERLQKWIL